MAGLETGMMDGMIGIEPDMAGQGQQGFGPGDYP